MPGGPRGRPLKLSSPAMDTPTVLACTRHLPLAPAGLIPWCERGMSAVIHCLLSSCPLLARPDGAHAGSWVRDTLLSRRPSPPDLSTYPSGRARSNLPASERGLLPSSLDTASCCEWRTALLTHFDSIFSGLGSIR